MNELAFEMPLCVAPLPGMSDKNTPYLTGIRLSVNIVYAAHFDSAELYFVCRNGTRHRKERFSDVG